jgi:hypothetical protein
MIEPFNEVPPLIDPDAPELIASCPGVPLLGDAPNLEAIADLKDLNSGESK